MQNTRIFVPSLRGDVLELWYHFINLYLLYLSKTNIYLTHSIFSYFVYSEIILEPISIFSKQHFFSFKNAFICWKYSTEMRYWTECNYDHVSTTVNSMINHFMFWRGMTNYLKDISIFQCNLQNYYLQLRRVINVEIKKR